MSTIVKRNTMFRACSFVMKIYNVAPGIQKKDAEEHHIGENNAPVKIFSQRIAVFNISTLFQKNLGDCGKKGSSQHNKDKGSIHISAPSILQIIQSGFR